MALLSVRMVELELEVGKLAARIARKLKTTRAGQEDGERSGGWVSPRRNELVRFES